MTNSGVQEIARENTRETPVDQTLPDGAGTWAFDEPVATVFDDMLRRSIPQYAVMRQAVFDLGCRYVTPGSQIVDLGCSRGEALAPFVERFCSHNRFVGIEVSEPMLAAARARFQGLSKVGLVDIRAHDLRRDGYPPVVASLVLSVFTLQFIPIEYRQGLVQDIYDHLEPGGAFLLVEKILGANAHLDRAMVDLYYGLKGANGYSQEQIERKRLSLEGVLVPVTARWNEELLRQAGFRQVDGFWRWMNFAGWIAVKDRAVKGR